MIVEIAPTAEAEIRSSTRWYESQRPGLGLSFEQAVHDALTFAARFPEAGSTRRAPFQRLAVRRFPFHIYYLVETGKLIVKAVFHSRRDLRLLDDRDS